MTDTLLPDLQPLTRAIANHDPVAFLRAIREIQADAYALGRQHGALSGNSGTPQDNPYR